MAVPLAGLSVTLTRDTADAVRLALREAVNVGALQVTEDARRRVRTVLGPEQRMSRVFALRRNDKAGRVVRTSIDTIAKGGQRVNPYYRQADSPTRPVALVGARGPAHLIEHDRRGGYEVRPRRRTGQTAEQAAASAEVLAAVFGADGRGSSARLQRPGAIATPDGYFGKVRPGPIHRPQGGPITAAFRVAAPTIDRHAAETIQRSLDRRLGRR